MSNDSALNRHPAVAADDVIQIGADVNHPRTIAPGALGTAASERVEYADGRRLGRRRRTAVGPRELDARSREHASADRPEMLDARRLRGGVRREGALGLVVTADTRVLVAEVYGVVAEADRLIEGERVIELAVDKNVVARRFQIERA